MSPCPLHNMRSMALIKEMMVAQLNVVLCIYNSETMFFAVKIRFGDQKGVNYSKATTARIQGHCLHHDLCL